MNRRQKISMTQVKITAHMLVGRWASTSKVMAMNNERILHRDYGVRGRANWCKMMQTDLQCWKTTGRLNSTANSLGGKWIVRCVDCSYYSGVRLLRESRYDHLPYVGPLIPAWRHLESLHLQHYNKRWAFSRSQWRAVQAQWKPWWTHLWLCVRESRYPR